MRLEQAQAIVDSVVREAPGPVSVFVADSHGELVAAATMDGARARHAAERAAEGVHGGAQRRDLDGRAG